MSSVLKYVLYVAGCNHTQQRGDKLQSLVTVTVTKGWGG